MSALLLNRDYTYLLKTAEKAFPFGEGGTALAVTDEVFGHSPMESKI